MWFLRLKRSCGGAKREIVPVPVLFDGGREGSLDFGFGGVGE